MRRLSRTDLAPISGSGEASYGSLVSLRHASLDPQMLIDEIERIRPRLPGQARNGLLWSLAGFGEQSRAFLERALVSAAPWPVCWWTVICSWR